MDTFIANTMSVTEDGYDLWLRYRLVRQSELLVSYHQQLQEIVVPGDSPTMTAIRSELQHGVAGLLGRPVDVRQDRLQQAGLLIGTPETLSQMATLNRNGQIDALGPEGYLIRSTIVNAHPTIVIAAQHELGALYGSFHFLRLLQTHQPLSGLDITERPKIQWRLLNHWDNLDGSIERGYAGRSLVWRYATHTPDDGIPDHPGISGTVDPPGLLGPDVERNSELRHLCPRR